MLASDPLVGLTDYASALDVLILRILIFIKPAVIIRNHMYEPRTPNYLSKNYLLVKAEIQFQGGDSARKLTGGQHLKKRPLEIPEMAKNTHCLGKP